MPSVSRDAELDFSPSFCSVCDQAHNKRDSLYCSARCRKVDANGGLDAGAKTQLSPKYPPTTAMDRSRSQSSLYALSNQSSGSVNSETRSTRRRSSEHARAQPTMTRPVMMERTHSSQRPLPPIKRNSYSSSLPRSVDLVTPMMTPLTSGTYQSHVTTWDMSRLSIVGS